MWSQLIKMHIVEREKLSYIMDKTALPTVLDTGYEKWYAKIQKVIRWLLMSMPSNIIMRYP